MDYMQKKDAKLILIVAPYAVAPEDEETYQQIRMVADEYGVELIDYNQKMELNVEEDLNDASHLNYWGSCKFTEILGDDLKQRVELPGIIVEMRHTSPLRSMQNGSMKK